MPTKSGVSGPSDLTPSNLTAEALTTGADIDAITLASHPDPFAVLGIHPAGDGFVARCFIPGAETVTALARGRKVGELTRRNKAGFFDGRLTLRQHQPLVYVARAGANEWRIPDAYCYGPVLGPMDDYYMAEGSHLRLFDRIGCHLIQHEGAKGAHFAVWAPNAKRVSVVGDFNEWDGRRHVMRFRIDSGIWEIFIPEIDSGHAYKFEIRGAAPGRLPLKADPFARRSELRPANASVTAGPLDHKWGDAAHLEFWRNADPRRQPISIYEVHPGSWRRRDDGTFLSWDELADRLIPYVTGMGFTHIEFMPVMEHPLDASWGYQTTGIYSVSARFGDPAGFARFVDGAHRAGIGVILDWVPAHFPTDAHGLTHFDGSALYEHADPRQGFHPDWQTAIYNFGRREVQSYLINNALYWAEAFHADGLRVDAVASMLYLDYSRKEGQWVPNRFGGRENLEAVEFLRRMNHTVHTAHPGMITIAEESTAWPQVSQPPETGGLGFNLKWNMGFMHDTLRYLARDSVHRKFHHNDITFGLMYAWSENFVLALSHDEVVHGKGTLLSKMSGDRWQKFATLRAYYALMWGYPGKKLLFMGQEFAQRSEWTEKKALDWRLLDHTAHAGVRKLVQDLNQVYRTHRALHARDCEPDGFEWMIVDDHERSVFAWIRKAPGERPIAVISNFTPVPHLQYALRASGRWREILNTDAEIYGGTGTGNYGESISETIVLPPLATLYLERDPD
jgi:1,4-alpha-glucan branching enzyme